MEAEGREEFLAAGERLLELTGEVGCVGETMASFGREYCVDIMEVVGICWVVIGSFYREEGSQGQIAGRLLHQASEGEQVRPSRRWEAGGGRRINGARNCGIN
mmetsp:Transcript_38760/g.75685  ORF Transcript_38760/g.75685 Transcript_38760/m.75685 type:complete len:103 (-) Transcript_38760:39-347(-)